MQISAQTLLASQQTTPVQPHIRPAPGFAATLEKSEGFVPLPLKQTAPVQGGATGRPSAPNGSARPGAMIDIKV